MIDIISTDEDSGLRIESFAIIKYVVYLQIINYIFLSPCKLTKNLLLTK